MQEENLNVKKEEQVPTVYPLNSKLELVSENKVENNYCEVNFIKRPKFYLTLFIFNIIVFIITLFVIKNGPHYEFGYLFLIILVPILQAVFSVISIIIYEIYRKIRIKYPTLGHGKIYKFSFFIIILIGITLFFSL